MAKVAIKSREGKVFSETLGALKQAKEDQVRLEEGKEKLLTQVRGSGNIFQE